MRVCIKSNTGEDLASIEVEPADTVRFLKNRLWEEASLARCEQCLYFEDFELEDEYAIADYRIETDVAVEHCSNWHEPYCPGCSDCDMNFCSACGLYPTYPVELQPRPHCAVCNQGPAPTEEAGTQSEESANVSTESMVPDFAAAVAAVTLSSTVIGADDVEGCALCARFTCKVSFCH